MNLNINPTAVLMARIPFISTVFLGLLFHIPAFAQSVKSVTYDELYDEPYEINKLFMKLQPVITEYNSINMYVGFGLEAEYYHESLLDIKANFRRSYGQKFDLMQDLSSKNNIQTVNNIPTVTKAAMSGELIGTYHIKDFEKDTETKMILYRSSYRRSNKWRSKVPDHIKVPSKVRKIIGGRFGPYFQGSGMDVRLAMDKQGIESLQGAGPENVDQTLTPNDPNQFPDGVPSLYTNQSSLGFALGGSLSWIKNFAIKPTRTFASTASDMIITTYFDVLIAPWNTIENFNYKGVEYDASVIKHTAVGFRAGVDGKFNREFGWGYGAEMGMRPGVQKQTFFAVIKISIPIFSTNLNHEVEAFSK